MYMNLNMVIGQASKDQLSQADILLHLILKPALIWFKLYLILKPASLWFKLYHILKPTLIWFKLYYILKPLLIWFKLGVESTQGLIICIIYINQHAKLQRDTIYKSSRNNTDFMIYKDL